MAHKNSGNLESDLCLSLPCPFFPTSQLADACCLHVQRLTLSLSPRGVLTLLSAHSKLRHHGSVVLQDLLYLAETFMEEFDGRDFSALAHALGTLRLRPPGREWMAAFWRHSRGHLPSCSARELSTMLWGLGEWGVCGGWRDLFRWASALCSVMMWWIERRLFCQQASIGNLLYMCAHHLGGVAPGVWLHRMVQLCSQLQRAMHW